MVFAQEIAGEKIASLVFQTLRNASFAQHFHFPIGFIVQFYLFRLKKAFWWL
jgi:hypothetical protein